MIQFSHTSIAQLWRYYKVGVLNTLFGYGLYAFLLSAGLKMYAAQIVGHIIGAIFNYFSYSRHVFHNATASKIRFILSYTLNYLVGLASLALSAAIVSSPYVAGLMAMLLTSVINFIVLRRFVFTSDSCKTQRRQSVAVNEEVDHASVR